MYNDACVDFVDTLRRHQLLAPRQLGQLPGISYHCADERALAKVLVQRGWLTIYQVNQILDGRAAGLVIGAYHVLDRLGQGGLSKVYKARHSEYDWIVALKLLKSEVLASSEGRQQFLQEMEAMAQLNHPNIVQFCDVDQAGETFFYAMEFVDGTDLGKYVRLCGPLPVAEACDYVRQTALGLQHAHEHSLVHRDIKPVNLFLTKPPGQKHPIIKILDWGLASLRRIGDAESEENGGQGLIGTADYLPPEQASSAQSVDIRGDIYSLGCTLYYLLTGQPPFPDGTLMQKILAHQKSEPPPLESFRDDIPPGLSAVLRRMMAKNPDERYQTPCAVTVALGPFFRAGKKAKRKSEMKLDRPSSPPAAVDQGTPLPNSLADIPSRADRPAASRSARLGPDTMFPYRT